ncbi:Transcriptional regulatory protein CutR [[Clostridium] ultunense Esp]|nr:Transcriptional regulatory protein CutR [[Clostridium] ultunense Esp]
MRLLLVEDEEDLANAIKKGLQKEGFAVDVAFDGMEGDRLTEIYSYDLVLLDLNLPEINGLKLLQHIRKRSPQTRVLILTARTEIEDRIHGLNMGADDYLGKPFHFGELKARIHALLRRDISIGTPVFSYGPVELNAVTMTVTCGGHPLSLTRKELAILHYFLSHPDRVISSEELMEHVWDQNADLFSNAVRVHITSLRNKVKPFLPEVNLLETVPGIGYRLNRQLKEYAAP